MDQAVPSQCSVSVELSPSTSPKARPTAQTSSAERTATSTRYPPFGSGFGVGTSDHEAPSQWRTSGTPFWFPAPTAQTSPAEAPPTPYRALVPMGFGLGVGTIDQEVPSQCSARVRFRSLFAPTAQMSGLELGTTATPYNVAGVPVAGAFA